MNNDLAKIISTLGGLQVRAQAIAGFLNMLRALRGHLDDQSAEDFCSLLVTFENMASEIASDLREIEELLSKITSSTGA